MNPRCCDCRITALSHSGELRPRNEQSLDAPKAGAHLPRYVCGRNARVSAPQWICRRAARRHRRCRGHGPRGKGHRPQQEAAEPCRRTSTRRSRRSASCTASQGSFPGQCLHRWCGFAIPESARESFNAAHYQAIYPKATLEDYVNHIDYLVKRIGIDHVGIGSGLQSRSRASHGGSTMRAKRRT